MEMYGMYGKPLSIGKVKNKENCLSEAYNFYQTIFYIFNYRNIQQPECRWKPILKSGQSITYKKPGW